ncbi:aromatic aminotransferase ISS1-like [Camellia sinensis]|uniref:aromatic aminotransferase ISS1-like n=1 Tax=Camellia sinensis TaxID=4442 RepID=UPI0010369CD8|nr:aromatic aminotransferase ISS1-like [Camellia sinensis]
MVTVGANQRISDLCRDAGCWFVVDSTYEKNTEVCRSIKNYMCRYFVYDGLKHSCMEGNHIVNIFSFSKTYGMMGWRVGYVQTF